MLCKRCNGAGKVMGMGLIYQHCDDCDGSGEYNHKETIITKQNEAKTPPKRSRKRKIATDNSNDIVISEI
jgi:DnaJ-class molecular chaperone